MFEYFFDILAVYKYVVRIDKYIIKIDYNINIQKLENMTFMNCQKAIEILVRLNGITDYLNNS